MSGERLQDHWSSGLDFTWSGSTLYVLMKKFQDTFDEIITMYQPYLLFYCLPSA